MPGLTNDQLEASIEGVRKGLRTLLIILFLLSLGVSALIYWRHYSLVSWAKSTDDPATKDWGEESSQTGRLTSFLSHLSDDIHKHINLIEPGAQVAHKHQGDRHTDPPPPPPW